RVAVATHAREVLVRHHPHDRRAAAHEGWMPLHLDLITVAVEEVAVEGEAVRHLRHLERPQTNGPAVLDPLDGPAARVAARVGSEVPRRVVDERPVEELRP